MYLARKNIRGKTHYFIRESYAEGRVLKTRDMFSLGTDPTRYLIYPGGNAYYVDEVVEDRLNALGLSPSFDELDDIFWPFVRPDIRRSVASFRGRGRNARGHEQTEAHAAARFHLFDKRRVHYLKYGQMDQGYIGRVSPKLFHVLLHKSRDEIEQYFMEAERVLRAHEIKPYVYVIFDLQRFFTQMVPQALEQEKVDEHFTEEICRLHGDDVFWAGFATHGRLNEYLIRYVIMYFDNEYRAGSSLDDYLRNYIHSRRFFRAPPDPVMSAEEAGTIFGVPADELRKMNRRELSRLYRKMAQKHHPDKAGGDHDTFIRLTSAYRALVKRKK